MSRKWPELCVCVYEFGFYSTGDDTFTQQWTRRLDVVTPVLNQPTECDVITKMCTHDVCPAIHMLCTLCIVRKQLSRRQLL
jgi:hypothetical protein